MHVYLCQGRKATITTLYVCDLYTALTISNEEMCLSHLHIHDIVHKVYHCSIPIDNVIASYSNHNQDYFTLI